MNRRRFLYDSALASTLATFGMSALSQRLLSAANSSRRTASGVGKQCMVLWMQGGPSQIETFAPGEGAGLATSLAGMRTGEMVRAMHPHADKLCVLRSVGGRQGEHVRATHLLHTGFEPVPSFPRPSLGSILSHQIDVDALPRHVLLGDRPFGPAFLPTDSGPFVIADAAAASDQLRRVRERRDAMRHLRRMNTDFESRSPWAMTPDTQQRSNDLEQSSDMSDTALGDVLNVESASQRQRRRYGDTPFGRRTLVASRMLELGVPFVEVQMDGWDTHGENDRRVRGLCDDLLPAWSSLLEDLQKRGRLDDTLVIWMGEFGRTPERNALNGRDHFPELIPIVMSGPVPGGTVVGETAAGAGNRIGEKHSVADFFSTLIQIMGLDPNASQTTSFGSPTTLTDNGTPIASLLADRR